jgi:hypothetical protein
MKEPHSCCRQPNWGTRRVFDRALAIRKLLGMRMRGKPRRLRVLCSTPPRHPWWDRCACHGGLALLRPRSLEGFAALRIEFFPPSPFLRW